MTHLPLTRALLLLLLLTCSVAAGSLVLPNSARLPAVAVFAALIACMKARLVVLDFIGLRSSNSPLRPALMIWVTTILLVAVARVAAIAFVFAN